MKNITLALDEGTLEAARAYAQRHDTTLNALVRELLVKTVVADREAAVRERLANAGPARSCMAGRAFRKPRKIGASITGVEASVATGIVGGGGGRSAGIMTSPPTGAS